MGDQGQRWFSNPRLPVQGTKKKQNRQLSPDRPLLTGLKLRYSKPEKDQDLVGLAATPEVGRQADLELKKAMMRKSWSNSQ